MNHHVRLGDVLLLLLASTFIAALIAGIAVESIQRSWKRDAIKRGFAEYNSTNGQWQWKQPQEDSDE